MPKGGVRWPDVDKPRIGDVNADRRSLLGQLDGPTKQMEQQEKLRKQADELIEAAGNRQPAPRFSFQSPVGVRVS